MKGSHQIMKQVYYYISHFFCLQNDHYFGATIIFEYAHPILHVLKVQMIVCKIIHFEGINLRWLPFEYVFRNYNHHWGIARSLYLHCPWARLCRKKKASNIKRRQQDLVENQQQVKENNVTVSNRTIWQTFLLFSSK